MSGLTIKKVARLTKPGRYLDRDGLYLQVLSPTNRSWLLRYQLHGKKRWMGLGSVETFSLEEARARTRLARQLLADKKDPLELRRRERAEQIALAARQKTFQICVQEYYDAHSSAWTNQHRGDFLASLKTHVYPVMGNLPVAAIDEALVLSVLKPIWSTKTVTAQRIRRRIENVLDYAIAAKYRDRTGDNPAKWGANLKHLLAAPEKLAEVEHHPALPYADLPSFITELRNVKGVAARALEYAILSAARTGEVRGATWDEVDLEAKLWVIPAARMKSRTEHRVPLSRQAVELLRALPREGRFIFIGPKAGMPIGENAMRNVLKPLRPGVSVHGFRSTFRDWSEEQTSSANAAIEQSLAHAVASGTEKAYRRTDLLARRQRLIQNWGDYCSSPIAARGKVTPLRRAPRATA